MPYEIGDSEATHKSLDRNFWMFWWGCHKYFCGNYSHLGETLDSVTESMFVEGFPELFFPFLFP